MEWDPIKDTEYLLSLKNALDSDDIKIKEQIKKVLLENRYIIHVLNNEELEKAEAEADEYYGTNILPYYLISPTQSSVQNYLCYEVSYDESSSYQYNRSHHSLNNTVKNLKIVFYILCHQKNNIEKDTGIARHDLLAALIQDQFNWSSYFGSKIYLVSDVPSVMDVHYSCRVLTFEQVTDNNVVRTSDGTPYLYNKEIRTFA